MSELFHFYTREETGTTTFSWRYTNRKRAVSVGGVEYLPQSVKWRKWRRDLEETEVTIDVPAYLGPVIFFLTDNPPSNLWLTVSNVEGEPVKSFVGKVVKASFKFMSYRATITVLAYSRLASAELPKRRFSRACDWRLFEDGCDVDRETFRVPLLAESVGFDATRKALTHSTLGGYSDGWFTGGYVEIGFERAFILSHVGNTVNLLGRFQTAAGTYYNVYPGCNKTRDHCLNKFSNLARFGGFPYTPEKNPTTSGL